MGRFSQKLSAIAGESRFTQLELDRTFKSEKDRQALIAVQTALKRSTNENEAIRKIQKLGEKGIKVLVRLGKKALLG